MAEKKKSFDFTKMQLWILFLIGAAIGAVVLMYAYDKSFSAHLKVMKSRVVRDWAEMQGRLVQLVDQVIVLRKMYVNDKVKADYTMFDNVIDTRSRILGEPDEKVKADLLAQVESEYSVIIKDYNERITLRAKSFKYIAWGLSIINQIEDYSYYKDLYRNTAKEYDGKIKWYPMSLVAKKEKYEEVPVPGECAISQLDTRSEKYIPEELNDYRVKEKILKEKKQQDGSGAAAAEGKKE